MSMKVPLPPTLRKAKEITESTNPKSTESMFDERIAKALKSVTSAVFAWGQRDMGIVQNAHAIANACTNLGNELDKMGAGKTKTEVNRLLAASKRMGAK